MISAFINTKKKVKITITTDSKETNYYVKSEDIGYIVDTIKSPVKKIRKLFKIETDDGSKYLTDLTPKEMKKYIKVDVYVIDDYRDLIKKNIHVSSVNPWSFEQV